MELVLGVVSKVFAVQELEFTGNDRITIDGLTSFRHVVEPQDWRDDLFGIEPGVLPLLPDKFGHDRSGPDDQHEPVALVDGVADLMMKRQSARSKIFAVVPDLKPSRGEVIAQSPDERLIVSTGVGQEDGSHGWPVSFGG